MTVQQLQAKAEKKECGRMKYWGLLHDYIPVTEGSDGSHLPEKLTPIVEGFKNFSEKNHELLRNSLEDTIGISGIILEIGVDRDPESSTQTILAYRYGRSYLGVDIDPRSVARPEDGVHFLWGNSWEHGRVVRAMSSIGGANALIPPVSLLMIDGCHRIDACWNDWLYAEYVAPGGIVLIHDTRVFHGPRELAKAIDPSLFEVEWHFDDDPQDWGMVRAIRKH